MSKSVTPIVLSTDGSRHTPLETGDVLPVSAIPVSTDKKNLLSTDDTGVLLKGAGIISAQKNNPIVEAVDGKVYFDTGLVLAEDESVLTETDNKLRSKLGLRFDGTVSRLELLGKDDAVISVVSLPVAPGLPVLVEILKDAQPPIPDGYTENPYPVGTYLHMRFRTDSGFDDVYLDVTKLVDVYTGGRGILIEKNVVSVRVKEGGHLAFDPDCQDPTCSCASALYVDVNSMIDLTDGLLTVTDEGKITLDTDKLVEVLSEKISVGVSSDADNILSLGSDGKVYLAGDLGSL